MAPDPRSMLISRRKPQWLISLPLQSLTGAMTVSYNFFLKIQTLQGSAVDKLMRNTIVAVRSKELIVVKCEEIIAFI